VVFLVLMQFQNGTTVLLSADGRAAPALRLYYLLLTCHDIYVM